MNLENAREAYYEYSRSLSTINRQLALSGVAIIWFFVHPEKSQNFNFNAFKCSFILFCSALFCDLCHYAIATLIWGSYHRYKEKRVAPTADFKAPSYINWFSIIMISLKVILTIGGYVFLIKNTVLGNIFN